MIAVNRHKYLAQQLLSSEDAHLIEEMEDDLEVCILKQNKGRQGRFRYKVEPNFQLVLENNNLQTFDIPKADDVEYPTATNPVTYPTKVVAKPPVPDEADDSEQKTFSSRTSSFGYQNTLSRFSQ